MEKSNIIIAVKMINKYYYIIIGVFCFLIVCSCINKEKNIESQETELTNQDSINAINQKRANFVSDSIKASLSNTWTIYYGSPENIGTIRNVDGTDDNGCAFTTIANIDISDGIQISKKTIYKLYKVDSLGTLEWVKKILDWDSSPTLTVTKKHNYFLATGKKLQLYDNLGTLQIEKDVSSSKMFDYLINSYCFNENEITLVGSREDRGVIIKLDMQLNVIASHIFGNEPARKYYSNGRYETLPSTEYSQINSITKSSDGNYYFTGKKNRALWIGKVDYDLKPIWEKNDYNFEQNGKHPNEGNKIICEGINNIFVSSTYGAGDNLSFLMCVTNDGDVLWNKTFKGLIGDKDNSLMKFNNSLFLITCVSDGQYYTSDTHLYSKLYNVNFQGQLIKESNINVNGNNVLAFKIVSNTKNNFFVLASNAKNKNQEFSRKSLISKFNSNVKIGENIFDFSEEKAPELNINLDFNNNQQLADFLKIYDFRCSIGNGYSTVLSFLPNNGDVNSGRVQFTMLRIKGMGFDIVSEQIYGYTIDKTKTQNRIYFNTNMKGEIYLENDGTLIMNDISKNERYIYRYSKN